MRILWTVFTALLMVAALTGTVMAGGTTGIH